MADKKLFRKKPVVIEAIQWDGTLSGIDDIISVFPDIRTVAKTSHLPTNKCSFWKIGTLEGGHEVSAGDFVIRGVKGEYYPCKPDIFAMTYEPGTTTPPADAALADALEHAGTRAEFHPDSEIAVLCRKAAAALRARQPAQAVADGFVVIPAAWFDREIPRIDAGGANPITPDEHCCEWVLYQERERIHLALSALLAASKAGEGKV